MAEPAPPRGHRHALGFLLSGGVAFLVDAGVMEGLLIATPLPPLAARLISIATAMVVGWQMHRRLTFGRRGIGSLPEFLRFASAGWSAAALNYAIFAGIVLALPRLPPLAGMFASSLAAMVFSYLAYRFFVFRAPPPPDRPNGDRPNGD